MQGNLVQSQLKGIEGYLRGFFVDMQTAPVSNCIVHEVRGWKNSLYVDAAFKLQTFEVGVDFEIVVRWGDNCREPIILARV